MDPAGIGALLLGLAALITAIAGLRKADRAESKVAELRAQIQTQINPAINQAPVINFSPTINVQPHPVRTAATEGAAQLPPATSFELDHAQPIETEPSAPDPGKSGSES